MDPKIKKLTTLDDLKLVHKRQSTPYTLTSVKISDTMDVDTFKKDMSEFIRLFDTFNKTIYEKLYVYYNEGFELASFDLIGELFETDEEWETRLNRKLVEINREEAAIMKRASQSVDAITKRYNFYLETKAWVKENNLPL
jgi:hypothetical protein